jgi:hypothetical protein
MSADDSLSKAIPIVVERASDNKLYKKYMSPLPPDYHPLLDMLPLLDDNSSSLYGKLHWVPPMGCQAGQH